ncbi:MAG: CooT family nickel-binding protein [Spirochaetales bacterium]|nr:CooT family nickel-binding protein [Spirochaetales bacterium]
MCQATVYLDGAKILEDVIQVEPTEDGVELAPLFEETWESRMKDTDKLRVLLSHWVEHNEEHAVEFLRWADKAGSVQDDVLDREYG